MHDPHEHYTCVREPAQRRVWNGPQNGNETPQNRNFRKRAFRAYPTQMTALPPSPSTSLPGRTIVYSTPLSRICARNLPKWKQTFRETSKGVGDFQTLPKRERA